MPWLAKHQRIRSDTEYCIMDAGRLYPSHECAVHVLFRFVTRLFIHLLERIVQK